MAADSGTAVLDFGATPADYAQVTVTTVNIASGSHAEAFAQRDSTGDNNAEQHDMLAAFGRFSCGNIVVATSMIVRCDLKGAKARGQFQIRWVHS